MSREVQCPECDAVIPLFTDADTLTCPDCRSTVPTGVSNGDGSDGDAGEAPADAVPVSKASASEDLAGADGSDPVSTGEFGDESVLGSFDEREGTVDSFANFAAIQAAAYDEQPSWNSKAGGGSSVVASEPAVAESNVEDANAGDEATVGEPGVPPTVDVAFPETTPASAHDPARTATQPAPVKRETAPASRPSDAAVVPRSWLVLAATYGSVVTILLLFAVYDVTRNGYRGVVLNALGVLPHQLESLPDVTVDERGRPSLTLIREDAELPPGHTLGLDEERRFGDVRVKVLKVTREPLEIHKFTGPETPAMRPPKRPVLKLWIEFENVAGEREIAPLDEDLVYWRAFTSEHDDRQHANQFVCPVDEKRPDGDCLLTYDLVADEVAKGQNVDRELGPGEGFVTYIPSEQLTHPLEGPLVWRVQFRKGYARGSDGKIGVTTLIDVVFDADDVENRT